MSSTTRKSPVPCLMNCIWEFFIHRGFAPKGMYLLTVAGRKTGRMHTTVIGLVDQNGEQFLVAPYGEVDWVLNARVAQQVWLKHGKHLWKATVEELPPSDVGAVLKQYLKEHIVTRPYFDVGPDAPVDAFEKEAARHPVFLIHRL